MRTIFPIILSIFFVSAFVLSCKKEEVKPECDGSNPTYEGEIKQIIDANCTTSGCHDSGSSNGAWTSYSNLQPVLNDGRFEQEVLTDQTMPKNGSLSQDELNSLQCWVNNNYPEK